MRVLGRRWFAIVITVIVAGALGLIISQQLTPKYTASARIFLSTDTDRAGGGQVDLTRVVQTQAQFATSTQALDGIANTLQVSRDYVGSRINASPDPGGYFFTITATDDTQSKAVRLVKTAETVYVQLLRTTSTGTTSVPDLERARDQLAQQRFQLTTQQSAGDPTVTARADVLNGQIRALTEAIVAARNNATLGASKITLAEEPKAEGQTAPKVFVNVLIAALLGLFLSAAVIWARYLRRPTVLDGRAAADALGAPLIVGPPAGRAAAEVSTDIIVSAMAAVLSPTVKVVALTPANVGDLGGETVAGVAASWSDDQGVVLVLDASPASDVRAILERLPRATSGELPRWAHEPTCLARSSGSGRGHVLYNRVAPSRAARPGGLAPILADRAPVVDLVVLLTPPLSDLPMTAASALQADAVVVITSEGTRVDELAQVPRDWPALAERIVGVIHDPRSGFRRPNADGRAAPRSSSPPPPVLDVEDTARGIDSEPTDRYARPSGGGPGKY
jgi:capsular polysaccharide biosynthesis protein